MQERYFIVQGQPHSGWFKFTRVLKNTFKNKVVIVDNYNLKESYKVIVPFELLPHPLHISVKCQLYTYLSSASHVRDQSFISIAERSVALICADSTIAQMAKDRFPNVSILICNTSTTQPWARILDYEKKLPPPSDKIEVSITKNNFTFPIVETSINEIKKKSPIVLLPDRKGWSFDTSCQVILSQFSNEYDLSIAYTSEEPKDKKYERGIVFWWPNGHKLLNKKESAVFLTEEVSWNDSNITDMARQYKCICVRNKNIESKVKENLEVQKSNIPVFVIPTGADTDKFYPKKDINYDRPLRIGWCGNSKLIFQSQKDIKGIAKLQEIQEATKSFCEWSILDRYSNGIPYDQMPDWYRNLDILVITSSSESGPRPLIEGLASGLVVLSTNVGLVPELKDNCKSLHVLESTDSFLNKIKEIDKNRSILDNHRDSIEFIQNNYSINNEKQKWGEVIKVLAISNKKACVLVTTFNRPSYLLNLLHQLEKESVHVVVFDDQSTVDYTEVQNYIKLKGWEFVTTKIKYGKLEYLQFIKNSIKYVSKYTYQYYFFIQDDIEICNNFVCKSVDTWNLIPDVRKGTLFLLKDSTYNKSRWGSKTYKEYKDYDEIFWVDCNAFLFDNLLISNIDKVAKPPVQWFKNKLNSSGTGRQISHYFNEHNIGMFRTKESLVIHDTSIESLMNPIVRKADTSLVVDYAERKIYASLASIERRKESLGKTVESLLPQVDVLFVYLNNYKDIPKFLINKKITVFHNLGDLGDSGKFYPLDLIDKQSYHLTCDDDFIYPPGYASNITRELKKNVKSIVGFHGVLLNDSIKSYYKSRKVIHFNEILKQTWRVHILGTGVLGYQRSTIDICLDDFKIPNMADIWFAIKAQEQKIPMLCIPRKKNLFTVIPDNGGSIFESGLTAKKQTDIVKSIRWEL